LSTSIWSADADSLILTLPDSIQNIIAEAEATGEFESPEYKLADELYWKNFGERNHYPDHPLDTVDAHSNKFIYNFMWGPSEFTATGTLKNYDNHQGLKDIDIPVLFLCGEFDEARPQTVEKFQKLVPGSSFHIIPNSGHSTMTENPHIYNELLKSFLKDIEK
jgi:proline iminopeptidase